MALCCPTLFVCDRLVEAVPPTHVSTVFWAAIFAVVSYVRPSVYKWNKDKPTKTKL